MSANDNGRLLDTSGRLEKQAANESNLASYFIGRDAIAQSQTVVFTTFPNVGAKTRRTQSLSWNDFVEQLRIGKTYPDKHACPLLSFAEFGNLATDQGSLKHGPNVRHYTGVVGDYDSGKVTMAEAAARAHTAGIRCLFYTTSRHTPETPRWRVVAPLSKTCNLSTMAEMAEVLNGALGGILAPESISHGQGFYFGRVRDVPYEVRAVDEGTWLDDGPDLFTPPVAIRKVRAERPVPAGDNEAALLALGGLPLPPLEVIASAAAAIPNDGMHPKALSDWFEWRDVLWAIKDGAGEAGRDIAEELSLRHPECTPRDFAHQWERRESRVDGEKIRIGTLLARAKECGWIDPRAATSRDEQRRQRQQAENTRMQDTDVSALPTIMSVAEMEASCVWIGEGSQVGLLHDPRQVLSFTDFAGLTAASATEVEDKTAKTEKPKLREIPNANIWKKSPVRKTVATRTFHAGAPRLCTDPDGKLALNSWQSINRWAANADIDLFLEQLAYLFPDIVEREAFLNWLAHIEQRPGELPHYGWLHVASNTGTGRNWLASLLARLWRGQVAPNVDLPALLDSQFNGQLAGRIVAIVDEVQEGAGENPHRNANRLKSIVNAEFRDINPKFGRQYREHNSCRWLVYSNHDNALPITGTDRRFRVARHTAPPRSASDYTRLYRALSDLEFVNAVGVYLRDRDISAFNPGERPPMTDAKLAVIAASKSLIVKYAEDLVANWPSDVATNREVARALSDGSEGAMLTNAMRRALEELGCESIAKPLKVNGSAHRCWILRDPDKWRSRMPGELSAEARRSQDEVEHARRASDLFV